MQVCFISAYEKNVSSDIQYSASFNIAGGDIMILLLRSSRMASIPNLMRRQSSTMQEHLLVKSEHCVFSGILVEGCWHRPNFGTGDGYNYGYNYGSWQIVLDDVALFQILLHGTQTMLKTLQREDLGLWRFMFYMRKLVCWLKKHLISVISFFWYSDTAWGYHWVKNFIKTSIMCCVNVV